MENQSNRTVTIAIVAAVVALLLGLCAGAVIGGVAGYAMGQANRARVGAGSFVQPGTALPVPGGPGSGQGTGVTVQDVVAGSPAEQAGIQAGDVITQVDDVPLDANHALVDVLGQYAPGDRVRLTIERGGASDTVTVRLGASASNPQKAYLGIRYSSSVPVNPTAAP